MSEALEHLAALGYVERHRSTRDRRAVSVRLTELGVSAMQATSVLDTKWLEALLEQLTAAERRAAVHGLELFAVASARLKAKAGPRPRSPKT